MRAARNMSIPMWGRSYPDRTSLDATYKFKSLPVTEAAATTLDYVCEFSGGAAANETGVGGGLSGADLVLSQNSSVPGVSGGYRQITKDTNMSFIPTLAFINAFIQSAAGFSGLWRLKDLDVSVLSGNRNILMMLISTGLNGVNFNGGMYSNNRRSPQLNFSVMNATDAIGLALRNSDILSSSPAAAEFGVGVSFDYVTRTAFAGIYAGLVQPTKFSDFLYFSLNRGDVAYAGGAAMTGFNAGSYNSIVGVTDTGNYPNGAVGVKIASLTFSKYPFLIPS